jgi:glycine dehydrogenase subunit 2
VELIFEVSKPGRRGVTLPRRDVPERSWLDAAYLRASEPALPEVSEHDVVRHFTRLSQRNFSVDANFYPLGSCTMKYNPKFAEKIAGLEEFTSLHPLLPQLNMGGTLTQGVLELIYSLEQSLCEICGMEAFTTHPMAGAHGELTGIMLIAAYHKHHGNRKRTILIPDSGHGTNPASAAIAGFEVKALPSDNLGCVDFDAFRAALNGDVAGIMLTQPNTLGIFDPNVRRITDAVHEVGGLCYYDGANLNAILGRARPGDLGFDVVHVNLHKTFATPHGGGGPGAGPVGVCKSLVPYLPISRVVRRGDGTFVLHYDEPLSIGYIAPFYGNFLVLLKAYAYMLLLGREGLLEVSETAVLNANYVLARLRDVYDVPHQERVMHELVLSAARQAERGVKALDIAKALIDRGIHPPTIYFPLIVKEALMTEPTETESKETLDAFVAVMREIAELAERDPQRFHRYPETTPVGRLDEVKAARDMDLARLE